MRCYAFLVAILIAHLCFVVVAQSVAEAAQTEALAANENEAASEPNAFRDLSWGDTATDQFTTVEEQSDGKTICTREGDKLRIGDVELTEIKYLFKDGKLEMVYVKCDPKDSLDLALAIAAKYGEPDSVLAGLLFRWEEPTSLIELAKDQGICVFSAQEAVKRDAEEARQKAVDDL